MFTKKLLIGFMLIFMYKTDSSVKRKREAKLLPLFTIQITGSRSGTVILFLTPSSFRKPA